MKTNPITSALLGVAVGDALGVPYEFKRTYEMDANPCKGMVGFGTHNQPSGTWSDDTSLTLCLADALSDGYSLKTIADKFVRWRYHNLWAARGKVFDIGMTTHHAIERLKNILLFLDDDEFENLKTQGNEMDNGNGSLMRIIPLLFYIKGKPIKEQFNIVRDVSSLTHRHIRAAMACMIYLKLAEYILNGINKEEAYEKTRADIRSLWKEIQFPEGEQKHFAKIIQNDIRYIPESNLLSGGYVIESIEASLSCFLRYDNYEDAVLAGINRGHDTDTTGAITGGLCGLYYGSEGIPEYWIASIARLEDILELGRKLTKKYP